MEFLHLNWCFAEWHAIYFMTPIPNLQNFFFNLWPMIFIIKHIHDLKVSPNPKFGSNRSASRLLTIWRTGLAYKLNRFYTLDCLCWVGVRWKNGKKCWHTKYLLQIPDPLFYAEGYTNILQNSYHETLSDKQSFYLKQCSELKRTVYIFFFHFICSFSIYSQLFLPYWYKYGLISISPNR